ncbi:16S rRNA (adenine(1518)-N(6)/adenine(1519)-N(6))-dimethyltransferase RsmA [Stenotrophomonas lactitubi]|uniref:16S rRNA (adenine(1518)-N(6)/adenine(1519)-N(6))- dimethyltransferase RsmA n=1 Tax=Stenotrophomonas lactitubi TaxID=2045214 RepID=UPI0022490FCF|nr:16S rRNA (adenine(1518)-N(6)/adenine(1519)-N(6))-dimethyltransferase RsmA [Stenotrophomonas lactitubi]MCX2895151.1 16S rRNA (adenine(1518)-N(6)/adenine(1519)-N(6))-dimethyltransferase RsmA [Stenotrophomonas lactitubi]
MTSPHSPSGPVFSAPAKKQLGQHFLADRYYIDKIVMAVNPKDGDRLVEIGPGQGAITLPLLRVHPKMTVIEFDRDLIAPLTAAAEPLGELTIVNRDVLRVDFTELADGQPIRLVGNLPYNISSPILFHALEHAAVISDMHFMLQKEVVDRMAAGPGSKVFGRLSVMLQAYCEVTSLFVVPPGAFRPPPKVDSAVVRLIPRDPATINIKDHKRFADVVKAAFGQRRKTLRNALNNVVSAEQFVAAGVRPDARAEQLDVAEFIALANAT